MLSSTGTQSSFTLSASFCIKVKSEPTVTLLPVQIDSNRRAEYTVGGRRAGGPADLPAPSATLHSPLVWQHWYSGCYSTLHGQHKFRAAVSEMVVIWWWILLNVMRSNVEFWRNLLKLVLLTLTGFGEHWDQDRAGQREGAECCCNDEQQSVWQSHANLEMNITSAYTLLGSLHSPLWALASWITDAHSALFDYCILRALFTSPLSPKDPFQHIPTISVLVFPFLSFLPFYSQISS